MRDNELRIKRLKLAYHISIKRAEALVPIRNKCYFSHKGRLSSRENDPVEIDMEIQRHRAVASKYRGQYAQLKQTVAAQKAEEEVTAELSQVDILENKVKELLEEVKQSKAKAAKPVSTKKAKTSTRKQTG